MYRILYRLRVIWLAATHPLQKTYTANICRHRTKKAGEVTSYEERYTISMALSDNGNPDYCLDCIAKMSIRCAWCANTINIGDPVTLYIPSETYDIPKHAVRYDEDPRHLVGCLDWHCARTGADRQGFWVPPGRVVRVPSPIELLLAGKNGGNKMIILRDLSDPNDTGKII